MHPFPSAETRIASVSECWKADSGRFRVLKRASEHFQSAETHFQSASECGNAAGAGPTWLRESGTCMLQVPDFHPLSECGNALSTSFRVRKRTVNQFQSADTHVQPLSECGNALPTTFRVPVLGYPSPVLAHLSWDTCHLSWGTFRVRKRTFNRFQSAETHFRPISECTTFRVPVLGYLAPVLGHFPSAETHF